MGLQSLEISYFRNIESASLNFSPGLNLVTGDNAAGKTSLLEAIYCLGRVRSFRTSQSRQLIRHGQDACRTVGRVSRPAGSSPIGIERRAGGIEVHVDGHRVQRLSDLAGHFPVQVMSGDTETILGGGPRFRRQVMDWAMFHVEHHYRDTWQRYARALRQRNAALRSSAPDAQVRAWEGELVETGCRIDIDRKAWIAALEPLLATELADILPGKQVELGYQTGWTAGEDLFSALEKNLERDRARGYTGHGPHRADFTIRLDGRDVSASCSRGQQKSLVAAFALAQVKRQQQAGVPLGAFLLDDIGSELDENHRQRVLEALRGLGVQLFVSSIEALPAVLADWPDAQLFHVKHGRVATPV
jgi:DNA replication and repair protein RecF